MNERLAKLDTRSKLERDIDLIEVCRQSIRLSESAAPLTSNAKWSDIKIMGMTLASLCKNFEHTIAASETLTEEQHDMRERLLVFHDEVAHWAVSTLSSLTDNFTSFPPKDSASDSDAAHANFISCREMIATTCTILQIIPTGENQRRCDEILERYTATCPTETFTVSIFQHASVDLQTKLISGELPTLLPEMAITSKETGGQLSEMLQYMRNDFNQERWKKTLLAMEASLKGHMGKGAERLFSSWQTTTKDKYVAEELVTFINIWQRYGREKTLKLVQRYGLSSFKSLPLPILDEQVNFAESGNNQKQVIVVLLPFSDHNGALRSIGPVLLKLFDDTSTTHNIVCSQIKHRDELLRRLSSIRKNYGSDFNDYQIDKLIIGAHGSAEGMYFGPEESDKITTDFIKQFGKSQHSDSVLRKDAEVILISCSTGASGGLAEQISESYKRTTHAPDIPTNIGALITKYAPNGRLEITPDYRDQESLQTWRPNQN